MRWSLAVTACGLSPSPRSTRQARPLFSGLSDLACFLCSGAVCRREGDAPLRTHDVPRRCTRATLRAPPPQLTATAAAMRERQELGHLNCQRTLGRHHTAHDLPWDHLPRRADAVSTVSCVRAAVRCRCRRCRCPAPRLLSAQMPCSVHRSHDWTARLLQGPQQGVNIKCVGRKALNQQGPPAASKKAHCASSSSGDVCPTFRQTGAISRRDGHTAATAGW